MIKIFRKIRQKLLLEEKTASYLKYAAGEIILVVIGILIALQINNWNEVRKTSIKEKAVLASIHKEFIKNRTQLDTVVAYHSRAYNACNKLAALFPIDIKTANLDSISSFLWDATYFYTFNPSESSITSIINTSSFEMIRNDSLREILVSWKDLVGDYQEDEKVGVEIGKSFNPFLSKNLDFHFNLNDKRNNLQVLETLEFEFWINLRKYNLMEIFTEGAELSQINKNINTIIELTKPK